MNAAIARLLPRASATSVANVDAFVTVAIFSGLGLLLSLSVLVLDKYTPGDWFWTERPPVGWRQKGAPDGSRHNGRSSGAGAVAAWTKLRRLAMWAVQRFPADRLELAKVAWPFWAASKRCSATRLRVSWSPPLGSFRQIVFKATSRFAAILWSSSSWDLTPKKQWNGENLAPDRLGRESRSTLHLRDAQAGRERSSRAAAKSSRQRRQSRCQSAANAPSITRKKLNDLFAFGRIKARHLFGTAS
jgi:hypothetical protein